MKALYLVLAVLLVLGAAQAEDSLDVTMVARLYDYWGNVKAVDTDGAYAYIATSYSGLRVVDITDPEEFVEVARCPIQGKFGSIVVEEGYAYVTSWDFGLWIVDVRDPENPVQAGHYQPAYGTYYVAVDGGYAYLATRESFEVVDVSDPAAPEMVADLDAWGTKVLHADDLCYTINWDSVMTIIDVADPENPAVAGTYEALRFDDLAVEEGNPFVYLLSSLDSQIHVVDVSDPADPVLRSRFDQFPMTWSIILSGNCLFTLDNAFLNPVLLAYDVSDPDTFLHVGEFNTEFIYSSFPVLSVRDNLLMIAGGQNSCVHLVNIEDPENMQFAGSMIRNGYLYDIERKDDYLFVSDLDNGLHIFDISDPENPDLEQVFPLDDRIYEMELLGDTLYLRTGARQLHVLNVEDPAQPVVTDVFSSEHRFSNIAMRFGLMYAHCVRSDNGEMENGFAVFNPWEPPEQELVSFLPVESWINCVTLHVNHAYLGFDRGFVIIDISNPRDISEAGSVETDQEVLDLAVHIGGDENLYTLSAQLRYLDEPVMRIYRRDDPASPEFLSSVDLQDHGVPQGIRFHGNLAFVSDGTAGVRIIDVRDPVEPNEVGYYDTPGVTCCALPDDRYIYVADAFHFEVLDYSAVDDVAEEGGSHLPADFTVDAVYPNPFNSALNIGFSLPRPGEVTLALVNLLGQSAWNMRRSFSAGTHTMNIGRERFPESLGSGIYFLQVGDAAGTIHTRKVLYLK